MKQEFVEGKKELSCLKRIEVERREGWEGLPR
jgi:hypothetical protein